MLKSVLIKDTDIWDVATHTKKHGDILVEQGVIKAVEEDIPSGVAAAVIDGGGCFATTGWIDSHAHLYYDYGCIGIDPQRYQVPKGVTYGLDQGTAGADNYEHYREYVLYNTDMKIKNFLNISCIGMPLVSFELLDYSNLDIGKFKDIYRKYSDEIAGIKLRITERMCVGNAKNALMAARNLADELSIPIFLHATDCVMETEEILSLLRPGDTFTHTYAKTNSGILSQDGKVMECVKDARKRGIYFDAGHGVASLAFEVLEKALAEGFYPDTIGTDLHTVNIKTPVVDLSTTVSKFLYYGMKLEDALDTVTVNPYNQYHLTDKSIQIKVGEEADFVIWQMKTGKISYYDCEGACINANQWIVPRYTVLGNKVFTLRKD